MNYIVTGGAGFIGKNLVEALARNSDNRVCVIDNFISSNKESFLKLFENNDNVQLLEADITDPNFLACLKAYVDSYFSGNTDYVFHLACPASPPDYQSNPVHTLMTSIVGTKNMLEFATWKKSRILFTSTSEIYGDPEVSPQPESYRGNVNTIGVRACYDEGKRAAESLCFDYRRLYNTNIVVVRIFNTYGPHMRPDDGRVVSNFINQSLLVEPLTIYGDGSQTRSFCYVDDMVRGLLAAIYKDGFSGPVNLGNPNEISINELVDILAHSIGRDLHTVIHELPADDPRRRNPDITLANEVLGWHPYVSLVSGLSKTIEYFGCLVAGA